MTRIRAMVLLSAMLLVLPPQPSISRAADPASAGSGAEPTSVAASAIESPAPFGEFDWNDETEDATIADPFEAPNRKVFNFNDGFYFKVAKPVATGYQRVLPEPVRLSLRNLFDTLRTPVRFGNCLLQANFTGAVSEFMRATINILGGVGGLFDPATALDLHQQPEDFGQTLAVWGMDSGPYIVWPLVGPSSARHTLGYVGDVFLDPLTFLGLPFWAPIAEVTARQLNELSFRLGEYESFKAAALDPYVSMRDAYVSYRLKQIRQRGAP